MVAAADAEFASGGRPDRRSFAASTARAQRSSEAVPSGSALSDYLRAPYLGG